jgi:Phage integrase, N-terminal SAM-like domain
MRKGERIVPSRARFREFADEWIETQTQLRERTTDAYRSALRLHLYPRFGGMRVANITEDDAARMIREMQAAGYASSSILSALRYVSLSRWAGAVKTTQNRVICWQGAWGY